MAMPAIESHRWTADELRAIPEEPGKRFEGVDGELLVTPGPRLPHQSAQLALTGRDRAPTAVRRGPLSGNGAI